jgi:hypothetical protein
MVRTSESVVSTRKVPLTGLAMATSRHSAAEEQQRWNNRRRPIPHLPAPQSAFPPAQNVSTSSHRNRITTHDEHRQPTRLGSVATPGCLSYTILARERWLSMARLIGWQGSASPRKLLMVGAAESSSASATTSPLNPSCFRRVSSPWPGELHARLTFAMDTNLTFQSTLYLLSSSEFL